MKCANCEKTVQKPQIKFCCRDCNVSYYNQIASEKRMAERQKSEQLVKCPNCGNEFVKTHYSKTAQKYCSAYCRKYFLRKRWMEHNPEKVKASNQKLNARRRLETVARKVILKCVECNRKYTRLYKYHTQKYCSECSSKARLRVNRDWYLKQSINLSDAYVKGMIANQGIPYKYIDPKSIKVKREILKLKRLINEKQRAIKP